MSEAAPSPTRIAPLPLWRVAQAFLHTLYALFGGPEEVAARHTLTAKAHEALALWLRCAEAMLRRLILIEASAYEKPNTRPLLHTTRPRTRRAISFDAAQPQSWRVSFRCFLDCRRPRRPAPAPAGEAPALQDVSEPVFIFRDERQPPARTASRPRRDDSRHAQSAERGARIPRQDRLWVAHEPKQRFRSAWPLAERYEACLRVFNDPAPYARRLARRLHAEPHRLAEALRAPPEARHYVERFEALTDQAETSWRQHFSSA
ncbi:MAG: hypothetical protein AB7H66_08640 [Hyphomonadaceae bacterium]